MELALELPPSDGFFDFFNGENLDGWTVMGDPAGWSVEDGTIRSEGHESRPLDTS